MVIEIEHRISSLIYTKQEKYRPILYLIFFVLLWWSRILNKIYFFQRVSIKKNKNIFKSKEWVSGDD